MSRKGIWALRPCRASWPGGKATPASDENVLQEPALSEWKRCWSKLLSLVLECNVFETFWNRILLHWHLCCCQGQGLHAARLTFCKTRCRYQRSVMFTCLLGSSAFIAIQNDPNPLYNTVYFNLCVCFVWPWIQFDWNGRSQWMQSFWELNHSDLSLIYFGSRSSALLNCHKLNDSISQHFSTVCDNIAGVCFLSIMFFRVLRLVHLL